MDVVELEECRAVVERVAGSQPFSSAPKLRAFFLYVADCSLRGQPEEATEQQIGTRVFSRPAGYNSGEDSIVRSQARLLRMKLNTYFSTEEGKREPLVIEIPKGHYVPVFRDRTASALDAPEASFPQEAPLPAGRDSGERAAASAPVPVPDIEAAPKRRYPAVLSYVMLLAGLVLGGILGAWSYRRWSTVEARKPDLLWSTFFAKTPPTLVIYSNPLFNGTPSTGLKLVGPATISAPHDLDDDTYTGTGEVGAIRQLTRMFDAHEADFILKRSRLVTWDEARSSNLIFVGAPSQNPALEDLPALSQFAIAIDPAEHGSIVNRHPLPGEPASFPTNDKTQETAIIALVPGLETRTHILVVSGLTTIGTQTAMEFLCRLENIAQLAQQAGTSNGEIRPFEAVLQIGVSKGVGINAKLVLLHHH